MQAEIIAIGTELTSGEKLDTNSQWLSLQLADLGIPVLFHTTVADSMAANLQALQLAVERTDVVLITGGLGPTLDDLTRDVLAQLAGVDLELDAASLSQLEDFFRGRGRTMPERNRIQAMFPQGSLPLLNPIGTAPGVWMELPRAGRNPCLIAAMPGVPSEMYRMFFEQVRPRLPGGQRIIRRARINCFGIGESQTEELLGELTARGRDPEVGITAHEATITLRIVANGATEEECQQKIAAVSREARERLGDYVYGVEDEKLEDVVLKLLHERGETITTIEVATGGQMAGRFYSASERLQQRDIVKGSLVLTTGLDGLAQAAQLRQQETGADYVLAIGPESTDLTQDRPTTVIDILLLGHGQTKQHSLTWNGNPAIRITRAAKTALDMLRHRLLEASR